MLSEVNTCYPAKIKSFDPLTQTVTCQVSIETYFTNRSLSYTKKEAPLLIDVPVFTLQGGGWSITFPIKEGDDCLVLFAQRGYDHWLYSGAQETGLINNQPTPDHLRAFSPRDAICLVGIRPIPNAIKDFNADDVELRNVDKTQRIALRANGDIDIISTTSININADTVNVNSKTTNVKSDNVNVEANTTLVKSPSTTIECPNTLFKGNITVEGVVNCAGIAMGGAGRAEGVAEIVGTVNITGQTSMSGGLITSGDVVAKGKSLSTHTHTGNMGSPTSPPL